MSFPMYVDNFLHFPVGTTAPLGGFDPATALWRATDSGLVVRILSVDHGIASLDDVGDGKAHDDHFPPASAPCSGSCSPPP